MKYSISFPEEAKKSGEVALAQRYDINVSYKDLGAVCEAVKYMQTTAAIELLEKVMDMKTAIEFRRHNKHMGSRHELGGKKGKYPIKASGEVRLAILNAMANAGNNGNLDAEKMYIIHSTSNKTHIERRSPSKGSIAWGRGMYGRSAINHSDIEYAKIEIGIANGDYKGLTPKMKYFIGVKNKRTKAPVPVLKTGKKPLKERMAQAPAAIEKPKTAAQEQKK
jgi:large subunit ribosomal protein L22